MVGIYSHTRGDKDVTFDELKAIEPLEVQTETYCPVKHGDFVETCYDMSEKILRPQGYEFRDQSFLVNKDGGRCFFNFDFTPPNNTNGHGMTVVGRNSTDKSMSLAFGIGLRTFNCSNLQISADFLVMARHSPNIKETVKEKIILRLHTADTQFRDAEREMGMMQQLGMSSEEGYAFLVKAWEADVIDDKRLRGSLRSWRKPEYDYGDPTLWSAYSTVTENLRGLPIHKGMEAHRRLHRFTQDTYFPGQDTDLSDVEKLVATGITDDAA